MSADPQTTPQGDASRAIANLPCACSDDESCDLHRLLETEPPARASCPPQNTDVRTFGELVETVELVRRDLSTKLLGADGQSRVSERLKAVQHALHDLYAQEPARARTRKSVAEAFMSSRVVVSTREEWVTPLPAEAYAMADVALSALTASTTPIPGEAAERVLAFLAAWEDGEGADCVVEWRVDGGPSKAVLRASDLRRLARSVACDSAPPALPAPDGQADGCPVWTVHDEAGDDEYGAEGETWIVRAGPDGAVFLDGEPIAVPERVGMALLAAARFNPGSSQLAPTDGSDVAPSAEALEQGTGTGAIVEDARGVVVKRVAPSEEGPDFIWKCGLWDFPESTRDIAHLLAWPVTIVRPGQRASGAAHEQ